MEVWQWQHWSRFVVVLGFTVYCVVDLARAEEFRYLDRETWALICLVSLPLGGIIYLAVGRKRKVRDPAPARGG